jgi:hypothetical protein
MLKKSEGGYFGRPVVRSMLGWMQLAVGGSIKDTNEAVVNAHMTPGFGLDKVFAAGLAANAKGSYLEHIVRGGTVYSGDSAWMNKRVAEYATAIGRVRAAGAEDSASLLREILSLKGAKGTFEDSLLAMVDEEDLIDAGEEVTEEMKRAIAMAPLRPMNMMAEHFKSPANLLRFVEKMKASNERTQKKTPTDKEDWKEPAVLVGTVHGWKGLQAKHCYVSMAAGVFPNFRSENDPEPTALDEERRLAYVALTRGEETVTVLSPKTNYLGKPSGMSRFVSEACIPIKGDDAPTGGSEPGGSVSGTVDSEEKVSRTAAQVLAINLVASAVDDVEDDVASWGEL